MMKDQQELMRDLVDDANTPALSLSWSQNNTQHAMAYGKTEISAPSRVDTNTLFQAASLSKPVSAAIVLDLVDQGKWDLDIPLADIDDYGPVELREDPYYRTLTTRMIIGQCSGLANFGQDGDDGKKFIATPNTRFTYSGVALDFLKDVIEKQTHKKWDEIAQEFFKKAGMKSSTFADLSDTSRDLAKAHLTNSSPDEPFVPLPVLSADGPGMPAGGMLTTAEDYVSFLQYCFKDDYLRATLLTGALSTLPPTISPEISHVQWGLGMGIYSDNSTEKTISFHWGNNPGSIAFCAMDMETGDCVAIFSNSMNGPTVFQAVAEPIVGDMTSLFQWLSTYTGFSDVRRPKEPNAIHETVHSIQLLSKKDQADKSNEVTNRFKQQTQQVRAGYMAATHSSKAKEREPFVPSPFSTTPKPPWKP